MMSRYLAVVLLAGVLGSLANAQEGPHFDGQSWWETVKVLADDKMEGRETGSQGLDRAEAWMTAQLKSAGVEPGFRGGFLQSVPLRRREIVESQSSLTLVHHAKLMPVSLGRDAYFSLRIDQDRAVEAPLVFAGYGLDVPEAGYNDLHGLDLKGKIAVVMTGSPSSILAALASHYQSSGQRWKTLRQAGAIGIVTILNPWSMDIPWERNAANRTHPVEALDDPALDDTAGEKLAVTFNPAHAEELFVGTGHTFDEISVLARDRKPMPSFPLQLSLRSRLTVKTEKITSANVVAVLPGTDPALKGQYIVLSAHIDHLGIGAPINGDAIYNGAMDNAAGDAVVLDVARSLQSAHAKLRRSILFVFFTGEEEGLLGSKYFTAHPPVPAHSIVADVNTDMFLPIIPLKILRVYGLEESTVGETAQKVADSLGIAVQADPEPLRNVFIRSDQYNFILHGIPSIATKVGYDPDTPEQKIMKDWLTNRYHAPSDDTNQPVDMNAAARFEEIVRDIAVNLANNSASPQWSPNSFFRRYAQGQ
jgi:Zn-dependent M28 family amino/carboxypeptidase